MLAYVEISIQDDQGRAVLAPYTIDRAHHTVSAPVYGGQPTGRRTHGTFNVAFELHSSVTALAQAAEHGTALVVRLSHFIYNPEGAVESEGMRFELAGARIVRLRDTLAVRDHSRPYDRVLAELELSYERITWQCVNTFPSDPGQRSRGAVAVGVSFTDSSAGRVVR